MQIQTFAISCGGAPCGCVETRCISESDSLMRLVATHPNVIPSWFIRTCGFSICRHGVVSWHESLLRCTVLASPVCMVVIGSIVINFRRFSLSRIAYHRFSSVYIIDSELWEVTPKLLKSANSVFRTRNSYI